MPRNKKKSDQPDIFDKLTDSSQYTGTHQHRFDATGKGRGLAGRDRIAKGVGTSDIPYTGGPILDIAQVMRPNLRMPKEQQLKPVIPVQKKVKNLARCKEGGCGNKCSPSSKWGFCAFHMWVEKEETQFPKEKPSISFKAAETRRVVTRKPKVSTLCSMKKCGNDRSPTSTNGYCAYHSWKEQEDPSIYDGKTNHSNGGKAALPTTHCVVNNCNKSKYKMGYCQAHFQEVLQQDEVPDEALKKLLPKNKMRRRKHKSSKKRDKILRKLTDTEKYTGTHQHRFGKDGKGLGLDGRESIPKGGVGYGKYHGGTIRDISQILRQ